MKKETAIILRRITWICVAILAVTILAVVFIVGDEYMWQHPTLGFWVKAVPIGCIPALGGVAAYLTKKIHES